MWPSERVIWLPSWWQKLQPLFKLNIQWACVAIAGGMPLPLSPVPGNWSGAGGWSSENQ